MKKDYRVMICGSRTFNDYSLLEEQVILALNKRNITRAEHNIIIISGKAKGADTLGEQFAKQYELQVEEYPAKWNDFSEPCRIKYNKFGNPYNALAGMNRNTDMINVSDLVIMFHDGKSKGTFDDWNKCKKLNKDYEYILYK